MLIYLIMTTRATLLAAIIGGVLTGYTRLAADKWGKRVVGLGACLGLIFSIWMAVMRNTTSKVDTGFWNSVIYGTGLCAFLLFLFFLIAAKRLPVCGFLVWISLGVLCATLIAYAMPQVWAYPYQVLQAEKTIISTDFLYDMIGMAGGLLLAVVVFFAAWHCTLRISEGGAAALLALELLLNAIQQLAGLFSVLLQKRIVVSNHTMFSFAVFTKNHSDWFLYAAMLLVFFVAVGLWAKSFSVNEPYANPAEHRKIRAKWRNIRRWATVAGCAFALAVCNLTIVDAMSHQEVSLSPIEESEQDDENVYVSFDQVSDGHLHRFAYETENGVAIRFIVIQKPNSSSYGIGLDACDICGETGYYEKDGQVVCKLCDVVMNISTIGFKGGCNPIVIPYEIKNGRIIVPIAGLMEYEGEFK